MSSAVLIEHNVIHVLRHASTSQSLLPTVDLLI